MERELNFLEMCRIDKTHKNDRERQSMFYILSRNDELRSKIHHIYDFESHIIKPECLTSEKVDFSGGTRKMIELAFNLYNRYPADVSDTFGLLDEENLETAMNAIRIRFRF